MRLKKLKSYNSKFFIYFIFLVFNFSLNASECKNIVVSKSEIFILNNKNAKKFKFTVDLADTKLKREIGLQCKKDLKENEGMLFIWNSEAQRYFWMKNTKFHLDIIFINADFKIVDIFFNAKPFSLINITSSRKAKYVLELKNGVFENLDLKIGDKLVFKKK
jgi:uncharacterized membrane protein (UPF0127 family)